MALIFMDGFDHYTTADVLLKWDNSSITTISANGRRGGQSARSAGALGKVVPAQTEYIIGAAVNRVALTSNGRIFSFDDGATVQVRCQVTPAGHIVVTRGTSTVLATSPNPVMRVGVYHYVEFQALINGSTGSFEVIVDGVSVVSETLQNTQSSGTAQITDIDIGFGNSEYDDLYILDTTGATVRDAFLGDCRIDTLYPDGEGNYFQFDTTVPGTPTTHWDKTEEATPDDDTSYNETATVNDRDSATFDNVPAITGGATVFGVQHIVMARKDDSGTRDLRLFKRISATDYDGTSGPLATSYQMFIRLLPTDLNGPGEWTDTIINGAEFGYEVTA